jgi:hypothetical protein
MTKKTAGALITRFSAPSTLNLAEAQQQQTSARPQHPKGNPQEHQAVLVAALVEGRAADLCKNTLFRQQMHAASPKQGEKHREKGTRIRGMES